MEIDAAESRRRQCGRRENLPIVAYHEQFGVQRGKLRHGLLAIDVFGLENRRAVLEGDLTERIDRRIGIGGLHGAGHQRHDGVVRFKKTAETSAPRTARSPTITNRMETRPSSEELLLLAEDFRLGAIAALGGSQQDGQADPDGKNHQSVATEPMRGVARARVVPEPRLRRPAQPSQSTKPRQSPKIQTSANGPTNDSLQIRPLACLLSCLASTAPKNYPLETRS